MKDRGVRRAAFASGVLGLLCLSLVPAAARQGGMPSGVEILRRIQSALNGVEDYTVTLDVAVDLERLKVPHMRATMYFKQPDKIHFESEGFALLPREGLAFSFVDAASQYTVESVEEDSLGGSADYLLTLVPKADRHGFRRVLLEVNRERWTADRVTSELPDGRTIDAVIQHQEVRGHWLPAALTVTFSAAAEDTVDAGIVEQITPTRTRQLPRSGTVVVRYSDYRINTGLSDDLFRHDKKEP